MTIAAGKAEAARRWAESLILQLPKDHEGRNSWLMNHGTTHEAEEVRNRNKFVLGNLGGCK